MLRADCPHGPDWVSTKDWGRCAMLEDALLMFASPFLFWLAGFLVEKMPLDGKLFQWNLPGRKASR